MSQNNLQEPNKVIASWMRLLVRNEDTRHPLKIFKKRNRKLKNISIIINDKDYIIPELQVETLYLAAKGMTIKEIAKKLECSERIIRERQLRFLKRNNVNITTDLVKYFRHSDLLEKYEKFIAEHDNID